MALYRLKKVKLNRDGKKYGIGSIVELSAREVEVLGYGIERVDLPVPIPTPTPSLQQVSGGDDTDTVHDLDLSVLEGNALSVKEYVNTLDDYGQLEALRKAEVDGKARSGVVNAIDARMGELTTT